MEAKTVSDAEKPLSRLVLLGIAYCGFVSLGLPDPVAGVAWPFVRNEFHLQPSGFGLAFIALGCGYCASGFIGGKLSLALGLGNLLWISSGLVAAAMFGSGLAPVWPVFVACAVVWGVGSGGIDAGLNDYVSRCFSARHVNWLHACYSLGTTAGPLLMTAMLVKVGSWREGYHVIGSVLLVMAALFLVTRHKWSEHPRQVERSGPPVNMRVVLREPLVWLQMALFFVYVGLEFTVGQWSFTLFTESRGVRAEMAGILVGSYYGAICLGRILSGAVVDRTGVDRLLRIAMLIVLAGAALYVCGDPVEAGYAGCAIIGLGLAPVFPSMMSRTPERLGTDCAAHAVGFQVAAGMLGAALGPGLAGLVAQTLGLELVAWFALLLAVVLFTTHELILYVARRATVKKNP